MGLKEQFQNMFTALEHYSIESDNRHMVRHMQRKKSAYRAARSYLVDPEKVSFEGENCL